MADSEKSGSPPATKKKGPDPLLGRVINGRFRIGSLIARGGMGKVFRAEQAPLGREVALKILNPNYHGEQDPEFHRRFFLEASVCSKLTHPNTVTIFDYGRTDDDIYYIAMELLEGRTLYRALREEKPLAPARAMHIARQICRSLREAHSLGVIHRDLKPANIFLVRHGDEEDFVKVLDFGLVKNLADQGQDLTQTGLFMGSPKYMSPEQIRGDEVDARADVYSLGIILYEMLTGKVPFDRPNSVNILMAHVHETPPRLEEANPEVHIPTPLRDVVFRALAKDPKDRFASMDEILLGLKDAAGRSGLPMSRSSELRLSSEYSLHSDSENAAEPAASQSPRGASSDPKPYAPLAEAMPSLPRDPALPADLTMDSTTPRPATEPEDSGQRRALITALALGVAVAGGAFFALRGDERPPNESGPSQDSSAPVVTPREPSDPPPVEDPTLPTPARVMVQLRSMPPGAEVVVDDRRYGPTPVDVEWTGEHAAPMREVTFRFELDGHHDFTVTRRVTGDTLLVEAPLQPRRRPPRRRDSDETSPGLEGFKRDPYR